MKGMRRFGREDNRGPDGKYGWAGSTLHIWVNGTNSGYDWAQNVRTGTANVRGVNVNRVDYEAAMHILHALMPDIAVANRIHLHLVSRAGGPGFALTLLIPNNKPIDIDGWSMKRGGLREFVEQVMLRCKRIRHVARRGDIVPFLPPWYAWVPPRWYGRLTWPWVAHISVVKAAAEQRHELSKRLKKDCPYVKSRE
jgi:hypothetical protein